MMRDELETLSDDEFRNELFLKNDPTTWRMGHLIELERRGTSFLTGNEKVLADNLINDFQVKISASVKPISDELERQRGLVAARLDRLNISVPKIEIPTIGSLIGTSISKSNRRVSESRDLVVSLAKESAQHQKAQNEVLLQILGVLQSTEKSQLPKWVGWVTLSLVVLGTAGQLLQVFR